MYLLLNSGSKQGISQQSQQFTPDVRSKHIPLAKMWELLQGATCTKSMRLLASLLRIHNGLISNLKEHFQEIS